MELTQLFEVYPPPVRATMPAALRVNGHLYVGNLTGADPVSGAIATDVSSQLDAAVELLRAVAQRAGFGLDQVTRVIATAAEAAAASEVETALGGRLTGAGVETNVASLPPGVLMRLDAFAAVAGEDERPEVTPRGGVPAAVRFGDIVYSAGVTAAVDGAVSGDTEAQMRGAFAKLDRVLADAGVERGHLLRIGGYLSDLGEKDILNAAMVATFPAALQKPVHKYVPAALPPGVNVSLQFLARSGAERQIVEVEHIKHNDPISLGAKAGNLFVSSRVQGRLAEDAASQAEWLVDEHAREVLRHVGGGLSNVTQTVWGVGDPAYGADIERVMQRHWPEGRPDVRITEAYFTHSPLPRVEFVALID